MHLNKFSLILSLNSNLPIKNISLVSIIFNCDKPKILIKYEQDKTYYTKVTCYNIPLLNILYEHISNSPLWIVQYNNTDDNSSYSRTIHIDVSINVYLIPEYINKSIGLLNIMEMLFSELADFNSMNFANKSYISYCEPYNINNEFKISLYDYQKRNLQRMINIENNQGFEVIYTKQINFEDHALLYNPILNRYTEQDDKLIIRTNGGIISDAVGMGKTFTTLSLIHYNKPNMVNKIINRKIASKASLIICPSHLVKQWKTEIKRCMPKANVICILTKNSHSGLKFKDFVNADIIITSHQFIMNFKYYPTLHYSFYCSAGAASSYGRLNILNTKIDIMIHEKLYEDLIEMENPIFEFFNFNRLIVDESHEIFGGLLSSQTLTKYMTDWLLGISAKYKWYVSGTPFININGLLMSARYIKMKLMDVKNNINIDFEDSKSNEAIISQFIGKDYIWDRILKHICIRHHKDDVSDQITIPGYVEEVKWIELNHMERELYNINKNKKSRMNLQKLCCHLLMMTSTKKIFGDEVLDLSVMQDKIISYHKQNYINYEKKIQTLDSTNAAYSMLKKAFETQMRESKYLYTILEKMIKDGVDDECPICMDTMINPTVTNCGHVFCFECSKACIQMKGQCPMCKKPLHEKDLMLIEKKEEKKEVDTIQKYGSKLGCIIMTVKEILDNPQNRIIIFSQWDDMLNLVRETLKTNKIQSTIVKGNAAMRDNSIKKFNEMHDNRVIMLSLKNGASGTNLTIASHIIFVEPIDASKEEIKLIEGQAIGRACRIGQTKTIKLIRILIKDTIEEEIYSNY